MLLLLILCVKLKLVDCDDVCVDDECVSDVCGESVIVCVDCVNV